MQLPGIRRARQRARNQRRQHKPVRHTSFEIERCRSGLLERVFAERWIHENTRHQGGILNALMPPTLRVSQRDAHVAATVVQWLGTNVGYGFLLECLRRAGEEVRRVPHKDYREQYWADPESNYRVVHPSSWFNLTRQHTVHGEAREGVRGLRAICLRDIRLVRRSLKLAKGLVRQAWEKSRLAKVEHRVGESDPFHTAAKTARRTLREIYDEMLSDFR